MSSRRLKKSDNFILTEKEITHGNFDKSIKLLNTIQFKKVELNQLMTKAVSFGKLDILKFFVNEKKLNPSLRNGCFLNKSIEMNYLDIFDYLISKESVLEEARFDYIVSLCIDYNKSDIIEKLFKIKQAKGFIELFDFERYQELESKEKIVTSLSNF
jgi:hypothetical protein